MKKHIIIFLAYTCAAVLAVSHFQHGARDARGAAEHHRMTASERLAGQMTAALEGLDEVARMDAIVSKSVHETSLKSARNRVAALEYAMKRLVEDAEFGYCMDCGDAIPFKRLLSMPEASRCVNCAE